MAVRQQHVADRNPAWLVGRWMMLLLLPVIFILTACQGPVSVRDHPTSTAAPAVPTPTRTPSPAPTVTLALPTLTPTITPLPQIPDPLRLCMRGSSPADLPRVIDEANRVLAARGFNARLEIVTIAPLGYYASLLTVQESPLPCDLFTIGGDAYTAWAAAGRLLPLDPAPFWSNAPAAAWDTLLVQPSIYAVPGQNAWVKRRGVSIRADVVDALDLRDDIAVLASFEDLTPILAQIHAAVNSGVIKTMQVADAAQIRRVFGTADLLDPNSAGYDTLAFPLVVRFDDPSGTVRNWLETPEFERLASLRRAWREAGYGPDLALSPETAQEGYRAGRYVVEIGRMVWAGSSLEQASRFGYEWIVIPIAPAYFTISKPPADLLAVNAALAQDGERAHRALMLLELLHADGGLYNLLSHGIEGEHWRWVDAEQKVITRLPDERYLPDFARQLGGRFLSYAVEPEPPGFWLWVQQENARVPQSRAAGFAFYQNPTAAEFAALQLAAREALLPLEQGEARDVPREIGRVQKVLQEAGLPVLAAEVQQQFADWLVRTR
jgi:putative aldouronate transport system substrate-binding protein